MNILAIESSCDETAAAVVRDGRTVLSSVIATQVEEHRLYGGVVPEIASRRHAEAIVPVVSQALGQAEMKLGDIDAIAVTYAPGLIGALLVGVNFAKGLSMATGIPLVPTHHLRSHIASNYISNKELKPPFLCLVVSGGHSHIVMVEDYTRMKIIGRTRDDAAGEAFDKAARTMGMPYPGGIMLDKVAEDGDPHAFKLPRPVVHDAPYDFSFSGLKSAVLNTLNECKMKNIPVIPENVAASFQAAVIDSMRDRVLMAIDEFGMKDFAMAGGVASNQSIRKALQEACESRGVNFYCPPPALCTDNAAMIGLAGYYEFINGKRDDLTLNAVPGLRL